VSVLHTSPKACYMLLLVRLLLSHVSCTDDSSALIARAQTLNAKRFICSAQPFCIQHRQWLRHGCQSACREAMVRSPPAHHRHLSCVFELLCVVAYLTQGTRVATRVSDVLNCMLYLKPCLDLPAHY
jgi:hypothetical protein